MPDSYGSLKSGRNANSNGRYLMILVVYAPTFEKNPEGVSFRPPDMSQQDAVFLQQMACQTVGEYQDRNQTAIPILPTVKSGDNTPPQTRVRFWSMTSFRPALAHPHLHQQHRGRDRWRRFSDYYASTLNAMLANAPW